MVRTQTKLQLHVEYDAPARLCRRVLRILPLTRPNQRVISEDWRCVPAADFELESPDNWGNRRLLLQHRRIQQALHLELLLEVETTGEPLAATDGVSSEGLGPYLLPSRLADLSPEIRAIARKLAAAHSGLKLAQQIGAWTHQRLRYCAEPLPMPLPAGRVLEQSQGSCQDFAHLMIALCRAAGMPARYVAGYNLAEGQLHAWAEVLCIGHWHAYDPTRGAPPLPGTVAAALGRDYRDARPITGQYHGAGAQLTLRCRSQIAR